MSEEDKKLKGMEIEKEIMVMIDRKREEKKIEIIEN